MMALWMVVVAALVGARGPGQAVMTGLTVGNLDQRLGKACNRRSAEPPIREILHQTVAQMPISLVAR
jgi:hypothetical protein